MKDNKNYSKDEILIRAVKETDVDFIFTLYSDKRVTEQIDIFPYLEKIEAKKQIKVWLKNFKERKQFRYIITYYSVPIGTIGLYSIYWHQQRASFGYDLHPDYWSRGIMTNVISLFTEYIHKKHNIHRLQASVLRKNHISKKVLLNNNFEYEGKLKDYEKWKGEYVTLEIYSKILNTSILELLTPKSILYLYNLLKNYNIEIWIDGGWGIDALLGKQTRVHSDLDIVIEEKNLDKSLKILSELNFNLSDNDEYKKWNFVLINQEFKLDFHVITFDDKGNGIYGPVANNVSYPNYAFGETGVIGGQTINCISPKYQLESHSGYKLREKDIFDIRNLCNKFNLVLPEEFK